MMQQSKWTHAACEDCYDTVIPNGRANGGPSRLKLVEEEDCCFCGVSTLSGIYIRRDPSEPQFCNHKDD